MPLFATTVVMMGPTAQGVGIYPRSYITEAGSEKDAEKLAIATERKTEASVSKGIEEIEAISNAGFSRILYTSSTDKIPEYAIRDAHARGDFAALSVTGLVVVTRTNEGTMMQAVNHVSTGDPSKARQEAIDAAWKAHPDKEVVHASVTTASAAAVRKAALDQENAVVSMTGKPIPDVLGYATEAVNRYRQTALELDKDRARTETIYSMAQEASAEKLSRAGSIAVSSAAIDTYVDRRREGVAHAEARAYAAGETARRLDGSGRELSPVKGASREPEMSL